MSVNGEELGSQGGGEGEERSQLLERIRLLESENRKLREEAAVGDFQRLIDEMEGTVSYGMQVVRGKDEEIMRLSERMLEDNAKWRGYVKRLVDQIGRKNALIESMREELDRFFEKTKRQEAASRESQSRLASYEELVQIDQQLLKQSKQIEVELNGRIRKLEQDNKRYSAAIRAISETAKKKVADYSGVVDQQRSVIRHLASIVDSFRGRFMYNHLGRQSGALGQIGRRPGGDALDDASGSERMNPLEYEFAVVWSSCQEKLVRRRCDLLERSLSVENGQRESAPSFLDDLVRNQSISVSDAFCAYSDYVTRVLSLYELFCKSNILLQYLQFKALRRLPVGELSSLLKEGAATGGIVQWVCNVTSEIGFLSINLGSLIVSMRSFSGMSPVSPTPKDDDQVSFSASQVSQLPSMAELTPVLKWINNFSQTLLNDCLNQNVTFEEVKLLNRLLHAKIAHATTLPACPHENIDGKNAGIELLPVCCVDALMNVNMSLSILVRLNVGGVREGDLSEVYSRSLQISERFYSKCGSLSLTGVHYPIDDGLFSWDGLYWSRVAGDSSGLKASLGKMLLKQRAIYETIHDSPGGEGQETHIAEAVGQLLSSAQELETHLDGLLNPVHMDFGGGEEEGKERVSVGLDFLPEVVIAARLQRLIVGLDDQMELEIEKGGGGVVSVFGPSRERRGSGGVEEREEEKEEGGVGEAVPGSSSVGSGVAGFDSPKKAKYENSIRLLNEKVLSLRRELVGKETLYSSFEAMQGEYRKLQDHKQLLMRRLEEQELEMRISQDRARRYEDALRQMKVDSDALRRDLESLQNVPKIKAYSELDVLEPVYLRRLIRLMSNRLYELEMSRWNEKIAREDPNRLLRSGHSRRMVLLGQSRSRSSLDDIAARLLEREERRERRGLSATEESVGDSGLSASAGDGGEEGGFLRGYLEENSCAGDAKYSDLLALVREFSDLQKQIMLHKCSIPVASRRREAESGASSFEKEWEEYTRAESKLKYKLHIMKTSLQGLLYGPGPDSRQEKEQLNPNNPGDTYTSRKIGKISLRIPAVGEDSLLRMIQKQGGSEDGLKVSIGEWNDIIQSLVKITT